jgi:hypothetical protein
VTVILLLTCLQEEMTNERPKMPALNDDEWALNLVPAAVTSSMLLATSKAYPSRAVDWACFDYPFDAFEGTAEQCARLRDRDKIAHVLAVQNGEKDEDNWLLLFECTDGTFVYFDAWCDYTGFGCQGDLKYESSKDFDHLWNHCLDQQARLIVYLDVDEASWVDEDV